MKRRRFTEEEQVIAVFEGAGGGDEDRRCLPQARDLGSNVLQIQAKFGGMDVSDARKLKALEEENAKLKKLLAEQVLDNAIPKDVAAKKWRRPMPSDALWPTPAISMG